MTDRYSSKDISLKISDVPIIPERAFYLTSGAFKSGRKITFRYYGEIPLTNGTQFIVDSRNGKYRGVVGNKIRPHGRSATIMSRLEY